MNGRLFERIASQSGLQHAVSFSQHLWRRRHFDRDPGPLCSGLVGWWLTERLQGRTPLARLADPGASLLASVYHHQAMSFYPCSPEGWKPDPTTRKWIATKYGDTDWKRIQARVHWGYQGDFILYDLSRVFSYSHARIVQFHDLPTGFPCWDAAHPGTAIVGVLRYRRAGEPKGHRFAYYLDWKRQHHFFDPNAGEVIEPRDHVFFRWMSTFFSKAKYRTLEADDEAPFLSLYQLSGATTRASKV